MIKIDVKHAHDDFDSVTAYYINNNEAINTSSNEFYKDSLWE